MGLWQKINTRSTLLGTHPIRSLPWLGVALLFLGIFLKLTWELHEDPVVDSLDRQLLTLISQLRSDRLNGPAVDITALGSPTVLTFLTLSISTLLLLLRDRVAAAYLIIGSAGAAIATSVFKLAFTRPRPTVVPHLIEVSGFSYPSGHSLGATSIYLLLMFLLWRRLESWRDRAISFVFTAWLIGSICFSRLYLGVHYPSDVLSGACLGAAWVCLLTASPIRSAGN